MYWVILKMLHTVSAPQGCIVYKYVPSRVDETSSRYTGDDDVGETNVFPGIKRR